MVASRKLTIDLLPHNSVESASTLSSDSRVPEASGIWLYLRRQLTLELMHHSVNSVDDWQSIDSYSHL